MQQFWMWLVIHTSCFPHSQQIRQTHLFNLSECFCHEFILWRFMINLQRKTNTLALPAFKIIVVLNSHSNTFTHDLNSNKWWWWRFTAVWLCWFEAFKGTELQWWNWAAHEIQLQQVVSRRRKKIFKSVFFFNLNILPRSLIALLTKMGKTNFDRFLTP